jgi:hypothetical protein
MSVPISPPEVAFPTIIAFNKMETADQMGILYMATLSLIHAYHANQRDHQRVLRWAWGVVGGTIVAIISSIAFVVVR